MYIPVYINVYLKKLAKSNWLLHNDRVTKIFSDALKSDKNPLVAYYGAIAGLQVYQLFIFYQE